MLKYFIFHIIITGRRRSGKEVSMSKSKKTKTTIYTSKKKRTAAAVICIILAFAMVLPLLVAALV